MIGADMTVTVVNSFPDSETGYDTIEVADNTYWYDGADAGEKYDKEVLTTDPNFKNAAAGNFTPQGEEQVAKKTGDPRWL